MPLKELIEEEYNYYCRDKRPNRVGFNIYN